jgi:acyl transferase domain-containing protein
MAGRFPGAPDVDTFWRNLRDGVDCISSFSDEDVVLAGVRIPSTHAATYVKAGGVLDDIELFDAGFFGFSPRDAEILDPQQRLFLECAWTALEDAGYDSQQYGGSIGVYAGMGANDYLVQNLLSNKELVESVGTLQLRIANDKDFLATRTSYKLNLTGPSITVQTACSTSLVAIHLACEGLLAGACSMALAGGVSITLPQKAGYQYVPGGIGSPDGRCRAFDKDARGVVGGSGVGIVVLKRLSDAVKSRDRILAVILGSAINNDGSKKAAYTAPGVQGQARVIAEAMKVAGVAPNSIDYVEGHGSATELGDPAEIAALTMAHSGLGRSFSPCAIGSVKSNIGHLDAAAGVAGFIKTILMLQHRQIPPSLHFREANPQIDFTGGRFYVSTGLADWGSRGARRAGVSSFGLGGTNAHVILEEAPQGIRRSAPGTRTELLTISARTPRALEAATDHLVEHLEGHPDQQLGDVAYTLQTGRRASLYRRTLMCDRWDSAVPLLRERHPASVRTAMVEEGHRSVVFMFPGLGEQYRGMTRGLYATQITFREELDRCAELLQPILELDLREVLYGPAEATEDSDGQSGSRLEPPSVDLRRMLRGEVSPEESPLRRTSVAHPSIFAVDYALARMWMSWGVNPEAMIGHSLGEYVAACLAGVFSLEDGLHLVACRARMVDELPPGAMLALPLGVDELGGLLGGDLSLAAVNADRLCVLSGTHQAVATVEAKLAGEGVICRRLAASHAFHSRLMEPLRDGFLEFMRTVQLQPPRIPFISNVTGTWITPSQATDPFYWAAHLCQTIRFAEGVARLGDGPHRVLLEVGPGQTLISFVRQRFAEPGSAPAVCIPSLRGRYQRVSDDTHLLEAAAQLSLAGVPIDWSSFYRHDNRRRVRLPTYPFERQRHWIDPPRVAGGLAGSTNSGPSEACNPEPDSTATSGADFRSLETNGLAAMSSVQRALAQVWQEILGVATVGLHDDFFRLGGHSLVGTQVISRVREAFEIDVSLRDLFESPTVAQMAQLIETRIVGQLVSISDDEAERLVQAARQPAARGF